MPKSEGEGAASAQKGKAASVATVRKAARTKALAALDALETLMMSDGQTAVRLAAAREILDRGYGRPKPSEAEVVQKPRGMTVIVRKFTAPPTPGAPKASETEERG